MFPAESQYFATHLNVPMLVISVGFLIYGIRKTFWQRQAGESAQKGLVYIVIGGVWLLLCIWPFVLALSGEDRNGVVYVLMQVQECLLILIAAFALLIYGLIRQFAKNEDESPAADGAAYMILGTVCALIGVLLLRARLTSGLDTYAFYMKYFSWFLPVG